MYSEATPWRANKPSSAVIMAREVATALTDSGEGFEMYIVREWLLLDANKIIMVMKFLMSSLETQ